MILTRRQFAGSALALAAAGPFSGRAVAQPAPAMSAALEAIRRYGEAHRHYFKLPGMTLGVTAPGGFDSVLDVGFANRDAQSPITPDTLFQIGSITKSMTAALIHQYAAEGRLRLTDRISALLPTIPLPAGNAITIQHLLDHTSGLPDDAPMFADGGLWTGFAPGQHWSYSNLGYAILGRLAEQVEGKPLDRLLEARVLAPLGMRRSRGAIVGADRMRYAQGYEAADEITPIPRGVPLAPAAWVDVTFGAGCVASTAADMNLFLRSLAGMAQGRGGLGLAPAAAQAFTAHFVPSDAAGMQYGNGLMHVANAGRRYLHHTGGMVSFSSSFHFDLDSGVGAFASSTLSGFADYRPRLLTRFAVDAIGNALAARPLPPPPPLDVPLAHAAAYVGRYSGPAGEFEIRPGTPLTILADGQSAELQPNSGDLFATTLPRFRTFTLMFERVGSAIVGAASGGNSYRKAGASAPLPRSDPALALLTGRYVNDDPWYGAVTVVERGGRLWVGTEQPMTLISDNLWRIGEHSWSPERGAFAGFINRRPQVFVFSGVQYLRHDV
jgi:CubicO group peptidase (beta-lactamase class C family)